MDKEIYFMHCWFAEQIEQVASYIDSFGYGLDEAKIGDKGLEPIERRGYKLTWWYLPGSLDDTTEKEPLFTNIEFQLASDDYHSPTEVKITCSDNPYLLHYLTDLAVFLWKNIGLWDQDLMMQHPETDPYFKSLIDHIMNKEPENDIDAEKSIIEAQKPPDIINADTQFDFDVTFGGTKELFYEVLKNLNISRDYAFQDPYRWSPDYEHPPYQSKDMVYLWKQGGRDNEGTIYRSHKTLTFIKTQSLPENRTLLKVHIYKSSPTEAKWWDWLQSELEKQGWLTKQVTSDMPGKGHLPLSSFNLENTSKPLSIEDARKILEDIPRMKRIFQDYNLKTAIKILENLNDSWIASTYDMAGRWGPGIISERMELAAETIGRYLGAFKAAGIKEIIIDEEVIPIPHKSKK